MGTSVYVKPAIVTLRVEVYADSWLGPIVEILRNLALTFCTITGVRATYAMKEGQR